MGVPIAGLLVFGERPAFQRKFALPAVCAIALCYTTPWDNFLVYRGVWSYGADRVLFTIGYVPFEEYLFFLLQPVLAVLTTWRLLRHERNLPVASASHLFRRGGVGFFAATALLGVFLLAAPIDSGLYLGLILAWAAPPLAAMWHYGSDVIGARRRLFAASVLLPTLYLWTVDRLAIGLHIWTISDRFSLNWDPLGLPVEEAVFFLITNLLSVMGLFLFRYGDRIAQLRRRSATSRQP